MHERSKELGHLDNIVATIELVNLRKEKVLDAKSQALLRLLPRAVPVFRAITHRNANGEQFRVIRERVRELGLPEDTVIVDEKGLPAPTLTFVNGVEVQAFTGTDPERTTSPA
jgi:hypothetical protein